MIRGVGILLVLAAVAVAAAATYYLKLSFDLPDMQTEEQIVGLVGRSVEARRAEEVHETGGAARRFTVVARETLATPVGKALLVRERCPDYLTAPAATSLDFWRAQLRPPTGAVACAVAMSTDLASRLLLPSKEHLTIAADRLRGVLGREGLFAVWVSALPFDPQGPDGIEAASKALFHAEPQTLDWERASELVIASERWTDVAGCTIPPELTALRDHFLQAAAEAIPASAAEIRAALKQPLHCLARSPVRSR
ncbi:MAG: hypothetical protein ACYDCL_06895 [Myxococcales bacterium]